MSIFDKWNKNIDTEGLKRDIAEADEGQGDYKEVPVGDYEVEINKIELKECTSEKNSGKPMVSIWFKILQGEYKGSLIFYNQLIVEGWQISMIKRFLKSLQAVDDEEVVFEDYIQFNQLLLDIFEEANGNIEYLLRYGVNKKGYNTYEIKDVYDA